MQPFLVTSGKYIDAWVFLGRDYNLTDSTMERTQPLGAGLSPTDKFL